MNPARRVNAVFLAILATTLPFKCLAAEAAPPTRLPHTNLLLYADATGVVRPVMNLADWEQRRRSILAAMQEIMGPLPGREKRVPLEMQVEDEADCGSFVRRRIAYTSEPGGRVPAYLLVPKAVLARADERSAPAVLALHQTRPEGQKVVVGLANSPDDEYGVHLAERGFVVLAPPYTMLANYWPDLKALGYRSGTMKSIWDNIRGIDLLFSLPYVRTNGVGTIGHSLGGHNGVYTAVFDPRVTVVISSCGLDSYRDYYDGDPKVWAPGRGWCQDRYMPGLAQYAGRLEHIPFDFHEMIGALAPRVCFISAPLGDSNFRWKSVDAIVASAAAAYRLHGVPENLAVAHPECPHRFPQEMRLRAYELLEKHLSGPRKGDVSR